MTVETVADFVRAVRRSGILEPGPLAALDRAAAQIAGSPRDFAREMIRRTWLTPYQANQILLGNGAALILGSYLILERLGEGGMGQVFKARHRKLGRVVALKVIRKEKAGSRQSIRRFRREIKASAALSHPNIVMAFDADQAGDTHFLVMEYVEGTDLSEMMKQRGPLPADEACSYIRQAAAALQHAHERNLVHRDVKPQNLLVTKAGQVKLLDLGLARLQDGTADDSGTILTQEGKIVGTVDFLSPEQATNSRRVDIRSDLYSLGCTFYFLLAGRAPFWEGGPIEKLANHRWEEPEPLEKLRPDVPPGIVAVVRKLMAKRPEDRYQTPAELAVALGPAPAPALPVAVATPGGKVPLAIPVGVQSGLSNPSSVPVAPVVPRPFPSFSDVGPAPRPRAGLLLWLLAGGAFLGGAALLTALYLYNDRPSTVPEKSDPAALASSFTNAANMKFVLIPDGTFPMGTPAGEKVRKPDEQPAHDVTVSKPFHMSVTPVTQEQYQAVMGTNPSHFHDHNRGGPDFPVEQVSWEDAVKFCRRLSELPAEKEAGRAYRLPTEAEWEYACRAGSKKAYCFGNDPSLLGAYAWYGQSPEDGSTQPVGKVKPNTWGLFDVHGNVWQWCQDWYDPEYYQRSPRRDPQGPEVGATKVCRGGGWDSVADGELRAARRSCAAPTLSFRNTGFRVVCVPAARP